MVFTKDGFFRLLITAVISAVICILSALIFSDITLEIFSVAESIALGSVIWFVAEVTLDLVGKLWPHKILPSYIMLCIIIVFGTSAGLMIFGIDDVGIIIIIDIAAIICGMTIAIINRRRYQKQLNKQLKEFIEK